MSELQLIYASAAVAPFSPEELKNLLERSRANNSQLEISGMLLYHEGSFLQVLEGDHQKVEALSAKIAKDPRHNRMIVVSKRELEFRDFGDWAMGCVSTALKPLQGFSEFLINGRLSLTEQRSDIERNRRVRTILDKFRHGLWRQAIR